MSIDHSRENPYATPNVGNQTRVHVEGIGPLRVSIDVLGLFRRGWNLVSGQYWTIFLIAFCGLVLGSMVPLNLILGAMLVGIFRCLIHVERGQIVEFTTLFRGFDHFLESLIVMVACTILNFLIILPVTLIFVGGMFALAPGPGQGEPGVGFFVTVFSIVPLIIAAAFLSYLPFVFAFQLIADRGVSAVDAIKQSFAGVWMNLGGIILYLMAVAFLTTLLSLMCYIPVFLFLPVSLGSALILYRDVFPETVIEAQLS